LAVAVATLVLIVLGDTAVVFGDLLFDAVFLPLVDFLVVWLGAFVFACRTVLEGVFSATAPVAHDTSKTKTEKTDHHALIRTTRFSKLIEKIRDATGAMQNIRAPNFLESPSPPPLLQLA
jgi:hypothetical protein